MPLVRRSVYPTDLCLKQLPENGVNELEMVTNNALAGVIAQLSDLSKHAEDLFGELTIEATNFTDRARLLGERVTSLNARLSLEAQGQKQPPLTLLPNRDIQIDQQVVARNSLPQALKETYQQADRPPALNNLQKYRDDGKEPLKMYTNPDYFFELWREQIQKEAEAARNQKREKRRRHRIKLEQQKKNNQINHRPKENVIAQKRAADQGKARGAEFVEDIKINKDKVSYMDVPRPNSSVSSGSSETQNSLRKQHPPQSSIENKNLQYKANHVQQQRQSNSSIFPAPLPPTDYTTGGTGSSGGFTVQPPPARGNNSAMGGAFPQPPPNFPSPYDKSPNFPVPPNLPTPPNMQSDLPLPPPIGLGIPPPPAQGGPPPPPPPGGPPPPGPSGLPPPPPGPGPPPSAFDKPKGQISKGPSLAGDLMQQIQSGKNLRKGNRQEEKPAPTSTSGGWADSIDKLLEERRTAIDGSSDESGGSDDDDWDDDE